MNLFDGRFKCFLCGSEYPDQESAPVDCQREFEPEQLFFIGEHVRYSKRPEEEFIVLEVIRFPHTIRYRIEWGTIIIAGVLQEDLAPVCVARIS